MHNSEITLSITQAARLLGMTASTLRRLEELPCVRTVGNHRRYRLEDIKRYAEAHQSERAELKAAKLFVSSLGEIAKMYGLNLKVSTSK